MKESIENKSMLLAVSLFRLRKAALEANRGDIYNKLLKNLNIYLALSVGDSRPIINELRSGSVTDIDSSVLELLADHLDGKTQKARGPSRRVSKKDRDLNIYLEFKKLEKVHGYDSAIANLEKHLPLNIGRKSIEKVVTEYNKIFELLATAHDLSEASHPK